MVDMRVDFIRYMVAALDIYYRTHPDISAEQILSVIEWLRFEITESMIRQQNEKAKK